MSYNVKRCVECRHMVHVHKKGTRYILKNCCEHINPEHQHTPLYEREIKRYFS